MGSWQTPNTVIGIGGIIMKEQTVALVQLNYGPARGQWILPGGRVENGEWLEDALVREVKEETGLIVKFESIIAFRQRLLSNKNLDLYFIARCRFADKESQNSPKVTSPKEILDTRYWRLSEALSSPSVRPMTREALKLSLDPNVTQLKKAPFQIIETDTIYA